MNTIFRELKSIPGLVLSTTVILIITFWVLNTIRTNPYIPAQVQGVAAWAEGRATGQAYGY